MFESEPRPEPLVRELQRENTLATRVAIELERLIVEAITAAPRQTQALDAVVVALEATSPHFEQRRRYARKRRGLIATHQELQERELIKLASLAVAIKESLRRRGMAGAAADLVAEAGIVIFRNAFERWVTGPARQDLSHHIRAALEDLAAVTAGINPSSSAARARADAKPVARSRVKA